MQLIGQKNCGCTCRNLTDWGPIGPGLPDATCPACSGAGAYDVGTGTGSPPYDGGAPCEMIAIFDCQRSFERDGLIFLSSYRTMHMLAERLVEENCTWTARKLIDFAGTGSTADCYSYLETQPMPTADPFAPAYQPGRQYAGGFWRECHHKTNWPQYFPGVAQDGYVPGPPPDEDLIYYKTPRFGCITTFDFLDLGLSTGEWNDTGTNFDISGGGPEAIWSTSGICGWFDLLDYQAQIYLGGDRVISTPYVECLYNATRIMWEFSLTAGTLVGTTDYGEEVIYSAASSPACGARITLSLTSGQAWAPKKACVVPGYTRFITPCTDKEHVVACCDSGVMITRYASEFPGCAIPLTQFDAQRYRDVDSIPDLAAPGTDLMKAAQGTVSSSCGVFYGYWYFNCTTKPPPLSCIGAPVLDDSWGSRQYVFHQLTWCEAGEWKASIFCYGVSLVEGNTVFEQIFTTICMNVATTLIQCHPIFGHTWTCEIPGTYTLDYVPPEVSGTGSGYTDCVTRHPCCCSAATVDFPCCDDPVNQSLFLDLAAAGCADLDGKSADLSYQGTFTTTPGDAGTNRLYWTGSFDGGACGTLYVLWHISNTGGCDSVLTISNTADFTGICFIVNDQVSCPFTSKTYTATAWNNGVCPCCSGNVTATVAA